MKIRTLEMLSDSLAEDLSWRKKELSDLRFMISQSSVSIARKRVLSRSGITLLYAHWEGFVKKASTYYLEFVRMQRLKNKELSSNFVAMMICQQFSNNLLSKRPSQYEGVTSFFSQKQDDRAFFSYKDAIDTESNLKSKVLKEIVWTLGLDYSYFEPLEKLIDAVLLGKRNAIAHGEQEPINQLDYLTLHSKVIEMMDNFRTEIENAAVGGKYRS